MKPLAFEKMNLGSIEKCYAVLGTTIGGKPFLFYGGEGNGSLRAFSGDGFSHCDMVWEGGGGTMSIVPLSDGRILASRGFTSMVDSAGSTVELVQYTGNGFTHETLCTLDYLHRFDSLLAPDGTRYLFAAALHSGKKDKDDWSNPGHMYVGKMAPAEQLPSPVELKQLPGDFFMNHGFCKAEWEGREAAFTTSREGAFVWLPPEKDGGEWTSRRLLDFPVSDIAVSDIDGDGEKELACLLPFHGNEFHIYKLTDGQYREVYTYPVENDFYHAVISATIKGEKVFVGGARKLTADLFVVRWDPETKAFTEQQIDAGPGPSNLAILNLDDCDLLLSANRMIFEAAVYRF